MTEEYKSQKAKEIFPILKREIDSLVQLPHMLRDRTDPFNDACWFSLEVDTQYLPKKYPTRYFGVSIAFSGIELIRNITPKSFESLVKTKALQAQMTIDDMLEFE